MTSFDGSRSPARRDDEPWQIPAYRFDSFREKKSRYCVCIPVLNEGDRIGRELARMRGIPGLPDLLIADGGSTDGCVSPEKLRAGGARLLLTKTGPGRLSAQLRMGLSHALKEGYEGVIVIDGNDKDDPAAIPEFVSALDAGYDHLQGSRFIPGGHAIRTPPLRWLGLRFLHAPLLSWSSGFHYTDTTNGFRAYSRRFLEDPRVAPFREIFQNYELHYYLALRAARLGFRVKEIPVTRAYPEGKAPTKISGWKGNLEILRTLLKTCSGQFNP